MAELKDYAIGTLSLVVLAMLGFAVMPDDTHFSRDLGIGKYCDRLSSTEKTCYPLPGTRLGSKFSDSGWEEIDRQVYPLPESTSPAGKVWSCSTSAPCELIE